MIGDAPEPIEASLLQVYAPRDPITEFLRGDVTGRQLRVMIEHLPSTSPWHRASNGPWGDQERLLHQIESRLRDLLTVEHTALAALSAGFNIRGGATPPEPTYMRVPPPPDDEEPAEDRAAVVAEQDSAMAEFERFFHE